jgi:hypothetical protein
VLQALLPDRADSADGLGRGSPAAGREEVIRRGRRAPCRRIHGRKGGRDLMRSWPAMAWPDELRGTFMQDRSLAVRDGERVPENRK